MQLNGQFIKGARNLRSFWFTFLALVFGVIFIGLGIFFFVTDSKKTYEPTTATIKEIVYKWEGDEERHYVIIDFTEKDGTVHTDYPLHSYVSTWKVGDVIDVIYNVNDPNEVTIPSSRVILPIIFVALGGISAIVGIVNLISTIKRIKRKPAEIGETDENGGPVTFTNDLTENIVENKKYFFHFTGKLNQSYAVEDQDGKVVFECKLLKFNPIASNLFEFSDVATGDAKQIKIGKTITSSSEGGMAFVGDMLSSHFKIDKVNCWDYISRKGYSVRHYLEGQTIINYDILRFNEHVASIYPADFKDPFNENSMHYYRMAKGLYRLEIAKGNLPDIVMIAFIITQTYMVE